MTLPARPSIYPDWSDSGLNVQPTSGQIASGWATGQKPPAQFLNWWQNLAGGWIKYLDALMFQQIFGDGSDGAMVLNGTNAYSGAVALSGSAYILLRDIYATTCTISAPVNMNGYAILATTSISTSTGAYITCFSEAAVNAQAGVTQGPHGSSGVNGTKSTAGNALIPPNVPGLGGAGGNGGSIGSTNGVQTTMSSPTYKFFPYRAGQARGDNLEVGLPSATWDYLRGGGGGGAGLGDGTHQSGAGGYGGGLGVFMAPVITTSETVFDMTGGAGGAAAAGNCGGGGGGGGGATLFVCFEYNVGVSGSAFLAPGGAGGAGVGTGGAGATGAAGLTVPTIVNIGTGVVSSLPAPHIEKGVGAMAATGGSGSGFDYLDVTFAIAFADTTYVPQITVYSSDGNIVGANLIQKNVGSMRIGIAAKFNGSISYKCELAS